MIKEGTILVTTPHDEAYGGKPHERENDRLCFQSAPIPKVFSDRIDDAWWKRAAIYPGALCY